MTSEEARAELQRALGRVEGKIDLVISSQAAGLLAEQERHKAENARIEMIEKDIARIKGLTYAATMVASLLGVERVAKFLHLPF
jgi:hypothetical protein